MARRKPGYDAQRLSELLEAADQFSDIICKQFEWTSGRFYKAVQQLRDIQVANGDTITVVCEPTGTRGPWLYGLRAGIDIVNPEKSRWIFNRLLDSERRIKTIIHVLEVAVRSLDGRTVWGKKARIYLLHLKRAREEVELTVGVD